MDDGNTYQSPLYISLAIEALARCGDGWRPDAVTSVVMGFMALEAFVNEVAGTAAVLAKQDEKISLWQRTKNGVGPQMTSEQLTELYEHVSGRTRDPDPPITTTLAAVLVPATKKRVPAEERYDLILQCLGAPAGFKGREPRQGMWCLAQARHHMVHRKSDETTMRLVGGSLTSEEWNLGTVHQDHPVPEFARYLQNRNVLPAGTYPGPTSKDFMLILCRREVAAWACQVAVNAAREVVKLLPDSELRRRIGRQTLLGSGHTAGL